jgi:hypothetical protein
MQLVICTIKTQKSHRLINIISFYLIRLLYASLDSMTPFNDEKSYNVVCYE